jgi:hypothetical protein
MGLFAFNRMRRAREQHTPPVPPTPEKQAAPIKKPKDAKHE